MHKTVFKVKLKQVLDSVYFATLRDELFRFIHVYVSKMLNHLCTQCLEMRDVEKDQQMYETQKKWNQTNKITMYFIGLDNLQEDLLDKISSGQHGRGWLR